MLDHKQPKTQQKNKDIKELKNLIKLINDKLNNNPQLQKYIISRFQTWDFFNSKNKQDNKLLQQLTHETKTIITKHKKSLIKCNEKEGHHDTIQF